MPHRELGRQDYLGSLNVSRRGSKWKEILEKPTYSLFLIELNLKILHLIF